MQKLSLSGAWEFRQAGSTAWMPATVPGGVHTDLLALGKIPDPFVGTNEKQVMWVAEKDWEYRRTFKVEAGLLAEDSVLLVCDGLDTLARVSVNGRVLGNAENMFRQYTWDVKELLRPGSNEIAIDFDSTVVCMTAKANERPLLGVSQALTGGYYIRKAPCQFGWDWGPMIPPIGIWKDLRLEGYSGARLEDVHLRQAHKAGQVTIESGVALKRSVSAPVEVSLTVTAPDGREFSSTASLVGSTGKLSVEIKQPQLWWPAGYGEQPLYQVVVSLSMGGKLLDERRFKLGLRALELRREPDAWGESFEFVVNGVKIFCKGSNWIPADTFPTRITDQQLEWLISSAVAAHQNMLRVWGGGFYEEERFYDLCDRYGVLVWQDMIASCSIYPLDDPEFVENIHEEVIQNVRRLRHRASLALWCGNNEMETGWEFWHWDSPAMETLKQAYQKFFFHTLPEWIKKEDADRPYWPSSPSSNTPFKDTNSESQGDMHYWDVWHGRKPFTAYRTTFPRFMSEFGFQSLPPLETVKTYAAPKDWNMTSYVMEHHQRSASGNGLMIGQMTDTFRMPKDFPALVYLSMCLQAEGIRFGVEHWRRNKHRVAGTLIWQLNDCWPVASWSSIDYFGRWKALHYASKRFYAPLLLSVEDMGKVGFVPGGLPDLAMAPESKTPVRMDIHLTSDMPFAWDGEARWSVMELDGRVLEQGEEHVVLAAQESRLVKTLGFDLTEAQGQTRVFVTELLRDGKRLSLGVTPFTPIKHIDLRDPQLAVSLAEQDGQLAISVTAKSLAMYVELGFEGLDVVFSDNYFNLPAGYTVTVTCPKPEGKSLDELKRLVKVTSLYESF